MTRVCPLLRDLQLQLQLAQRMQADTSNTIWILGRCGSLCSEVSVGARELPLTVLVSWRRTGQNAWVHSYGCTVLGVYMPLPPRSSGVTQVNW